MIIGSMARDDHNEAPCAVKEKQHDSQRRERQRGGRENDGERRRQTDRQTHTQTVAHTQTVEPTDRHAVKQASPSQVEVKREKGTRRGTGRK